MKVTVLNDVGTMYDLEIDPQMSLENMMALLEAESDIPVIEQSLSLDGRELSDGKAPMATLGVQDNCVLLIRRKVTTVGGRPVEHDSEMMRLQLLGDPDVMRQLRTVQPDLVDAAVNDPGRFAELLRQTRARQADSEFAQQREVERLNANPFDIEAQRRIEEAIREQAVMENMQHAIEFSPESFGRVTMLYIPVEVNGVSVKAFVDSGAQQTIMSPECAERCNIMRLLDRRFAGVARGVGTAAILGRVHSAQLKLADLHLPCAFTIMEGRDVDLLFGLDMLKQHQACIDLDKNVLRINGREVTFLAEHELPEQARMMERPIDLADTNTSAGPSSIPSGSQPQFPGSGHALGNQPAGNSGLQGPPAPTNPSRYPESAIQTLIDLGATREVAIRTLDAAGGNVDYAASMLF